MIHWCLKLLLLAGCLGALCPAGLTVSQEHHGMDAAASPMANDAPEFHARHGAADLPAMPGGGRFVTASGNLSCNGLITIQMDTLTLERGRYRFGWLSGKQAAGPAMGDQRPTLCTNQVRIQV